MIQETFYEIEIKKITKGIRETNSYERIYADDSPVLKLDPNKSAYGYVSSIKQFTDTEILLKQKLEVIDINKIIKSVNKDL